MRAVITERYGKPEVLQIQKVEKPSPKSNEVLIKTKATSITAASTFMREGKPYFGRLFIGLGFSTLLNMLFVSPFTKKKLKFAATGMRKHEQRMKDLIQVRDMLASEKLTTIIDRVYPLEQIQEAHAYIDTGRKRGNVIVHF